jgi:hypothetical protein
MFPRLSRQIARTPSSRPAGDQRGNFMTGYVIARALEGLSDGLTVQLPGGAVRCSSNSDQPFSVGDQVTVAMQADGRCVVMGLA